jgi:hypothetical protein
MRALLHIALIAGLALGLAPVQAAGIWDDPDLLGGSSSSVSASSSVAAPSTAPSSIVLSSAALSSMALSSSAPSSSAPSSSAPSSTAPSSSAQDTVHVAVIPAPTPAPAEPTAPEAPPAPAPRPPPLDRAAILGPVRVSQVSTIAKLDAFRSPRKALFLSLAVPGLGQYYIGGSKSTIARGVGYSLAEVALGFSYWHYAIVRYDDKLQEAVSWLDAHYEARQYEERIRALYVEAANESNATALDNFKTTNLGSRGVYCRTLFGPDLDANGPRDVCENGINDVNGKFDDHISRVDAQGFRAYDRNGYLLTLESGEFLLGWDDAPSTSAVRFSDQLDTLTTGHLDRYRSLRSQANQLADLQVVFLGGLILNHLLSAVDAAITAHVHNQRLYRKDAPATGGPGTPATSGVAAPPGGLSASHATSDSRASADEPDQYTSWLEHVRLVSGARPISMGWENSVALLVEF